MCVADVDLSFFNWLDPSLPKDRQNTLGDETLPTSCWPDAKLMVDQLKELGVELVRPARVVSSDSSSVRRGLL